jgi:DNA-binding response OmpR family regulator
MSKPPLLGSPRRGADERVLDTGKARPSLLLIEDNPMVGHFLASAIEECGFEVVQTGSFHGFKQCLDDRLPDAVAMDLSIPDCEGSQIIETLADHRFRGLVLIISGLEAESIEEALQLGRRLNLQMAKPLAKPFRFDDLEMRLREFTSSRQ